jgi:single-strand DNA-binding protein
MASYNRIVMIGNLTRDPDYKQLTSGQAVCRLGIASNRQFKNRQSGTMVQEVCYIDVDVWGPQAESCKQYLQKGRSILVEGRIKFDTWEDQQGQTRNKHSIVADRIVFLSSGNNDSVSEDAPVASAGQSDLEKDLMDQITHIKSRGARKEAGEKKSKAAAPAGEINFTDEPPFQDELPF